MSQVVSLFSQIFPDMSVCPRHAESWGRSISIPAYPSFSSCTRTVKCYSEDSAFSPRIASDGQRMNSDFLRRKKQIQSQNKNSPLSSLLNSPNFQATSTPGRREKEILELFRKVQVRLRERNATKKISKTDALHPQVRDSETVNSLLKILRRHSGKGASESGHEDSGSLLKLPKEDRSTVSEKGASEPGHEDSSEYEYDEYGASFSGDLTPKEATDNEQQSAGEADEDSTALEDEDPEDEFDDDSGRLEGEVDGNMGDDGGAEMDGFEEYDEEDVEDEDDHEMNSTDAYERGYGEDVENEEYDGHGWEGELTSFTVQQLRMLAKKRGLKGFSKMKKNELVELINGSA